MSRKPYFPPWNNDAPILDDHTELTFEGAKAIYDGSNAEATKALYAQLERRAGNAGLIALNLFRAHKASARAKVYKGRGSNGERYRDMAYQKKQYSLQQLVLSLHTLARTYHIDWGWKQDENAIASCDPNTWVLYVDLPGIGQMSFHTASRLSGPDYTKEWDGIRGQGARRACELAVRSLDGRFSPANNLAELADQFKAAEASHSQGTLFEAEEAAS